MFKTGTQDAIKLIGDGASGGGRLDREDTTTTAFTGDRRSSINQNSYYQQNYWQHGAQQQQQQQPPMVEKSHNTIDGTSVQSRDYHLQKNISSTAIAAGRTNILVTHDNMGADSELPLLTHFLKRRDFPGIAGGIGGIQQLLLSKQTLDSQQMQGGLGNSGSSGRFSEKVLSVQDRISSMFKMRPQQLHTGSPTAQSNPIATNNYSSKNLHQGGAGGYNGGPAPTSEQYQAQLNYLNRGSRNNHIESSKSLKVYPTSGNGVANDRGSLINGLGSSSTTNLSQFNTFHSGNLNESGQPGFQSMMMSDYNPNSGDFNAKWRKQQQSTATLSTIKERDFPPFKGSSNVLGGDNSSSSSIPVLLNCSPQSKFAPTVFGQSDLNNLMQKIMLINENRIKRINNSGLPAKASPSNLMLANQTVNAGPPGFSHFSNAKINSSKNLINTQSNNEMQRGQALSHIQLAQTLSSAAADLSQQSTLANLNQTNYHPPSHLIHQDLQQHPYLSSQFRNEPTQTLNESNYTLPLDFTNSSSNCDINRQLNLSSMHNHHHLLQQQQSQISQQSQGSKQNSLQLQNQSTLPPLSHLQYQSNAAITSPQSIMEIAQHQQLQNDTLQFLQQQLLQQQRLQQLQQKKQESHQNVAGRKSPIKSGGGHSAAITDNGQINKLELLRELLMDPNLREVAFRDIIGTNGGGNIGSSALEGSLQNQLTSINSQAMDSMLVNTISSSPMTTQSTNNNQKEMRLNHINQQYSEDNIPNRPSTFFTQALNNSSSKTMASLTPSASMKNRAFFPHDITPATGEASNIRQTMVAGKTDEQKIIDPSDNNIYHKPHIVQSQSDLPTNTISKITLPLISKQQGKEQQNILNQQESSNLSGAPLSTFSSVVRGNSSHHPQRIQSQNLPPLHQIKEIYPDSNADGQENNDQLCTTHLISQQDTSPSTWKTPVGTANTAATHSNYGGVGFSLGGGKQSQKNLKAQNKITSMNYHHHLDLINDCISEKNSMNSDNSSISARGGVASGFNDTNTGIHSTAADSTNMRINLTNNVAAASNARQNIIMEEETKGGDETQQNDNRGYFNYAKLLVDKKKSARGEHQNNQQEIPTDPSAENSKAERRVGQVDRRDDESIQSPNKFKSNASRDNNFEQLQSNTRYLNIENPPSLQKQILEEKQKIQEVELNELKKKVEAQGDIFTVLKEIKDILSVKKPLSIIKFPSNESHGSVHDSKIVLEDPLSMISIGGGSETSNKLKAVAPQRITISAKTLQFLNDYIEGSSLSQKKVKLLPPQRDDSSSNDGTVSPRKLKTKRQQTKYVKKKMDDSIVSKKQTEVKLTKALTKKKGILKQSIDISDTASVDISKADGGGGGTRSGTETDVKAKNKKHIDFENIDEESYEITTSNEKDDDYQDDYESQSSHRGMTKQQTAFLGKKSGERNSGKERENGKIKTRQQTKIASNQNAFSSSGIISKEANLTPENKRKSFLFKFPLQQATTQIISQQQTQSTPDINNNRGAADHPNYIEKRKTVKHILTSNILGKFKTFKTKNPPAGTPTIPQLPPPPSAQVTSTLAPSGGQPMLLPMTTFKKRPSIQNTQSNQQQQLNNVSSQPTLLTLPLPSQSALQCNNIPSGSRKGSRRESAQRKKQVNHKKLEEKTQAASSLGLSSQAVTPSESKDNSPLLSVSPQRPPRTKQSAPTGNGATNGVAGQIVQVKRFQDFKKMQHQHQQVQQQHQLQEQQSSSNTYSQKLQQQNLQKSPIEMSKEFSEFLRDDDSPESSLRSIFGNE